MTGNQIKKVREAFGLSTAELADLLGVQNSSVYRWEACKSKTTKVEGLPKRLLRLMDSVGAGPKATQVAEEARDNGWAKALYMLLGFAYKKA